MRIAICNDSPLAVEALRRVVTRKYRVAWIARDGEQAVRLCAEDVPDLILMDLVMPGINGVEATRQIMAASPCAILVVTQSVTQRASLVFEALGAGALDAVKTPEVGFTESSPGADSLLAKMATMEKLIGHRPQEAAAGSPVRNPNSGRVGSCPVIAIGASSGGPQAVAEVLSGFPADLNAAVIVVQHIDGEFCIGLADWLSERSKLPVRLAREGDGLRPGVVMVAGGNDHVVINARGRLSRVQEPKDLPYRPSVNMLFESLATAVVPRAVGVLLTGMGADGASGLLRLRQAGWKTVAQDEATSAIFGMPAAAIRLGAAIDVLGLPDISRHIVRYIKGAG